MLPPRAIIALLACCAAAVSPVAPASADTAVKLKYIRDSNDRPVSQYYLLLHGGDARLRLPDPVAVLLLLPDGPGRLNLKYGGIEIDSHGFLVRTRHLLAAEGPYAVAVMDAASDYLNDAVFPAGLNGHRTSDAHFEDIHRVIADLRARFPRKKIWLVGAGRGSISAAQAVAEQAPGHGADGLILASPVIVKQPAHNWLGEVGLDVIKLPTMVMVHRADRCPATPRKTAKRMKQVLAAVSELKITTIKGGSMAISSDCGGLSAHGFFGVEQKAVREIANFINRF